MLLLVDKVTKAFAGTTVIESINLSLEVGDRFCLLGKNGAGKSTLLRMIVGMYLPDDGRILLHDQDLAEHPWTRRAVGFASDKPFLYDKLSCREHFALHAALYGLESQATMHRGIVLLERLNMLLDLDRRTETFSLGMRKKLSFVLSVLHAPSLLVLDEPLNGLDLEAANEIKTLLKEYNADKGMSILQNLSEDPGTILLSTHSVAFASDFGTHQGAIRSGRLSVYSSSMQEIEENRGNAEAVQAMRDLSVGQNG